MLSLLLVPLVVVGVCGSTSPDTAPVLEMTPMASVDCCDADPVTLAASPTASSVNWGAEGSVAVFDGSIAPSKIPDVAGEDELDRSC